MGNKVAGLDLRRQQGESVEDYKKRVKQPGAPGYAGAKGGKAKPLHAILETEGGQVVACGKKKLNNSTAEHDKVTCSKCLKVLEAN